jgi:hypothetical protein
MSYRTILVDVEQLEKQVESIKKTTNEIVAIVPALITKGIVMKYLIIYGN